MISWSAIFVISFTSFGITEGMPAFRARKNMARYIFSKVKRGNSDHCLTAKSPLA